MELVLGAKKEKLNYMPLYTRALLAAADQLKITPEDKQARLCSALYGVKYVNGVDSSNLSADSAIGLFSLIFFIKADMKEITPRELMQIFPVKKVYDGLKRGSKDYFYTMDVLHKHGLDKPLGENVQEILFDYTNDEVTEFVVAAMMSMDKIRRHVGEQTLIEEFAEQQGMKLQTYTMTKDEKGRRWLTDNDTGERQRVKVKRPRYLRAI